MNKSSLNILLPKGVSILSSDTGILPSLSRIAQKGELHQSESRELAETLFTALGMQLPGDIPIAAFENLALESESDSAWYIKARPINLVPDRAHLVIGDGSHVAESQALERELISGLNAFFNESGLSFICLEPGQWIIRSDENFSLQTTSFVKAIEQKIVVTLFEGEDARRWNNWNNEIQMWLHDCAINRQRQQQGLPVYNSLWLWGSGSLPQQAPASPWDILVGDSLFVRGLGKWLQVPVIDVKTFFENLNQYLEQPQNILCVPVTEFGSVDTRTLDSAWLNPVLSLFKSRRLERVRISFPNGKQLDLQGEHRWRFWRRGISVQQLLGQGYDEL